MESVATEPKIPKIPQAAPYVLNQLFRLGALTARMAYELYYEPVTMRSVQRQMKKLSDAGLVVCSPMIVESSPAVANLEDPDGGRETFLKPPTLRRHEKVYELTDEGKSFVAGDQEIPSRRVHQLYNKSHSIGRRQHSLLRNEFVVKLVEDAGEDAPYQVTDYWGEGGTGPIQLEKQRRIVRALAPDGVITLNTGDSAESVERAIFIEADTGNQRGAHIRDKIQQYSELYLAELLARQSETVAGEEERKLLLRTDRWLPHPVVFEDGGLMPVVFVSYYGERTRAIRKHIEKASNEGGMFAKLERYMEDNDMGEAASLFLFTNLQALRRRGAWLAYRTATSRQVRSLF